MELTSCPVCGSVEPKSKSKITRQSEFLSVECGTCGPFLISHEAVEDELDRNPGTPLQRAGLSHAIRARHGLQLTVGNQKPMVLSKDIIAMREGAFTLPPPTAVANAIIRTLGNRQRSHGAPIGALPVGFHAIIGAEGHVEAKRLVMELSAQKLLEGNVLVDTSFSDGKGGIEHDLQIEAERLTLDGWRTWESLNLGARGGAGGFIAMQFGDSALDDFVNQVVRPALAEAGYQLVRVDDNPRAGIIDNIMRADIQDADFVLVELSHGNRGAYWEAGYAEGLGKPVIYLCEKEVFEADRGRPHFDVNHCTTVIWSRTDLAEFKQQLIATVRNSVPKSRGTEWR